MPRSQGPPTAAALEEAAATARAAPPPLEVAAQAAGAMREGARARAARRTTRALVGKPRIRWAVRLVQGAVVARQQGAAPRVRFRRQWSCRPRTSAKTSTSNIRGTK